MREREIRAEIVLALAELYSDPLSRTQYKRFTFTPDDKPVVDRVLRQLETHLLIQSKMPGVVRLTDIGYRLLEPEFAQLRFIRDTGEHAVPAGGPPELHEVDRISREVGGADFVSATRLTEGRFVTFWATRGFEAVTGYTPAEFEAAGGWPMLVRDLSEAERVRQIARLVDGERISGEVTMLNRAGRRLKLRYAVWPTLQEDRVVGALTAVRRLPG